MKHDREIEFLRASRKRSFGRAGTPPGAAGKPVTSHAVQGVASGGALISTPTPPGTADSTARLPLAQATGKVLGHHAVRAMARRLVDTLQQHVTIDWTMKESGRSKLSVTVKRIRLRYAYPLDGLEAAAEMLHQAELASKFRAKASAK